MFGYVILVLKFGPWAIWKEIPDIKVFNFIKTVDLSKLAYINFKILNVLSLMQR